jgi:hypothetical protein
MFKHALWKKEYRQAKLLLWLIPIVCLLFMGVAQGFLIWNWLTYYEHTYNHDVSAESFYTVIDWLFLMRNVVLALLMVILAASLIGVERRNLQNDFTFSLPFSRAHVFLIKWGIGVVFLAGALLSNTIIDVLIILFSPFADHLNGSYHIKDVVFTVIIITGIYTFALFIGTITGSAAAQTILTGIFSIFPLGFMAIVTFFVYVNLGRDIGNVVHVFNAPIFNLVINSTLFFHVVGGREIVAGEYIHIWGPLSYIVVFLPLGLYCYRNNRLEYNGCIILFPQLQPVFKVGVALCFALSLGMFLTVLTVDFDSNRSVLLLSYYLGFIGGGLVTLVLMRKIMKIRFKV